jgi:tight adherence protein C
VALLLPVLAFLFAALLVAAAALVFSPRALVNIEQRLGEVTSASLGRPVEEERAWEKATVKALKRLGGVAPKMADSSKLQQRLVAAGYRSGEALIVFSGVRVGVSLLLFAVFATPIVMRPNIPLALGACLIAYTLASMVLARMARRRQHRIRLGLPDALDLLVVSVEAGLGLDQAIQRVGQELAYAHPDLCEEFRLVNLEMRAGKERSDALRHLADRTGVDDLASLVAMLIQTDKFGTSVAQSLRVFSDTMRTKRRQRAEEAAAKTGVKMVFPLVICIFPAIWVVTLGPAIIKFVEVIGGLVAE